MCEADLESPPADPEQAAGRPTIGDIFRQYGPAYRDKYAARMSPDQLRVMHQLERCRTGELGHILYCCDVCGAHHAVPQSCGNRHCPQCQGHKAKEWLETQLPKPSPRALEIARSRWHQSQTTDADNTLDLKTPGKGPWAVLVVVKDQETRTRRRRNLKP